MDGPDRNQAQVNFKAKGKLNVKKILTLYRGKERRIRETGLTLHRLAPQGPPSVVL